MAKKRANKTKRSSKTRSSNKGKKKQTTKVYYFKGRNTGVFAPNAKVAKQRKKRPKSDKIVAVRKPVKGEGAGKGPKSGRWSTRRRDGKTKAKSKYGKGRGQGPRRKK